MKKIKKRSKFQKCPKSFPGVQTCLGAIFLEKFFCSVFHGFIESFRKNQKNSKLQKCPRSYRKLCKLLLNMFCGNFLKKRMPRVPWRVGPSKKFKKKSKNFENSKKAQNIPKSVQTCFEHVLGQFFPTNFCPVFHGGSSLQKISKIQKGPKSFAKVFNHVLNMFWGDFFENVFCPVFHGGSGLRKFSKKSKKFKNPKKPKIVSKSVHTCFEHALGRCFRKFFAQCSMQCISDFLDLKIGVQFSETILNRLFFCIHATVKIRNPISDILDLKLWVQIPELKNMITVFRSWKMWVQFSGLKFWGRDLEKIKGKNQKSFKVSKMSKNVSKCPNVFWGDFLENVFFCPVFHGVIESFWKIKDISKLQKCPKSLPKLSNLFWTCFVAIFSKQIFAPCSMEGRFFESFQNNQKNFKIPKLTKVVFKSVQTCFEHALRRFFRISLPSVPCRAFQIFWT